MRTWEEHTLGHATKSALMDNVYVKVCPSLAGFALGFHEGRDKMTHAAGVGTGVVCWSGVVQHKTEALALNFALGTQDLFSTTRPTTEELRTARYRGQLIQRIY